jgi:hypothetical protein
MTLPFSKFPKAPFQQILDLILEAPMILTRANQLKTMPLEEQLPFAIELLQDCLCVEDGIRKLYLHLEMTGGGPAYWPTTSNQLGDIGDLLPTTYAFPNLRTGMTMILSWAALTVFWSGLCHLYQHVGFLTPLTPTVDGKLTGQFTANGVTQQFSLPVPSRFVEFPTMAQNVCRSVEFCMQDELGMTILACPLTMIIAGLASWPGFEREIALAKSMLACIQRKGMNIVQYICKP